MALLPGLACGDRRGRRRITRTTLQQPAGIEAAGMAVLPDDDEIALLDTHLMDRQGRIVHQHEGALEGLRMTAEIAGAVVAQPDQRQLGLLTAGPCQ